MKTRFFCVAVEGATTDGRVIEASWIREMAANYNPSTYGARVNMEHIRGYSPEPPFNSYGDVLALEAREIELTVNGKAEKKLALFAQIDANDQLVAINRKGQKLYTSIEVNPNFAGKGQAYLMGVAVTDSPASLGTDMLEFASKAAVNPFAGRKQHPENLFTATGEAIALEFEDAADPKAAGAHAFSIDTLKTAIQKAFGIETAPIEPAKATETVAGAFTAEAAAAAFTAALAPVLEQMKAQGDRFADAQRVTDQNVGQLTSDFTALKTQLAGSPSLNHSARPDATGGDGAVVTDC